MILNRQGLSAVQGSQWLSRGTTSVPRRQCLSHEGTRKKTAQQRNNSMPGMVKPCKRSECFACQAMKTHLAGQEAGRKGARSSPWEPISKHTARQSPVRCAAICVQPGWHALSARVNCLSQALGLAWDEENSHGVVYKLLDWAVDATTETGYQISWA